MPRRVLLLSSLYHPHKGGIETIVEDLCRLYREQGISTTVLTKKYPSELADFEILQSVPVIRFGRPRDSSDYPGLWRGLLRYREYLDCDVVHVLGARRPMPFIGLLLARHLKVPVLMHFGGGDVVEEGNREAMEPWREGLGMVPEAVEQCDACAAFSAHTAADARNSFKPGLAVDVLYPGIDLEQLRNAIPPRTDVPYILSARRLVPSKGIDTLLNAFAQVARHIVPLELRIIGDGPEEHSLRARARELGINSRVHFHGRLSLAETLCWIKGSLAHICPSRFEGGGMVNLEAQAAGTIPIGSRVGGIPEFIKHEKNGLLFEPDNVEELGFCIRRVVEDQAFRQALRADGETFLQSFSWKTIIPQYLSYYERMKAKVPKSFVPCNDLFATAWQSLQKVWTDTA